MKNPGITFVILVFLGLPVLAGIGAWIEGPFEPRIPCSCASESRWVSPPPFSSQLWELTDAYDHTWRFHDREALIEWVKAKNAELPENCFAEEEDTCCSH